MAIINEKWVKQLFAAMPDTQREMLIWGAGVLFSETESRLAHDTNRASVFRHYCANGAKPFLRGCLEVAGSISLATRGFEVNGERRIVPRVKLTGCPQYLAHWYEEYRTLDPIFDPRGARGESRHLEKGFLLFEFGWARRVVDVLWEGGNCRVTWDSNRKISKEIVDFVIREGQRGRRRMRFLPAKPNEFGIMLTPERGNK
jgi:hypothetical protein